MRSSSKKKVQTEFDTSAKTYIDNIRVVLTMPQNVDATSLL